MMTTREFSLQPALTHRKRLEEVCQMELAEAEMAYGQERRLFDLLSEMERLGYHELERQHEQAQLDLASINVYLYDLQRLQTKIEDQALLLESMEATVRQKREALMEAAKDKKALEKLKEKHEREIALALSKAENKVLEEIASSQFHRRRLGSRHSS